MVQRRMRIGVVGANGGTDRWGARAHLPAIAALEEAELVAVCTAREETAKRAQQRTGARLAVCDYAEMMRLPEVDLHPERRNAVTQGMWLQIGEILEDFAKDEAIRVVVLKGSGDKAFVSGAGISQFGEQHRNAEE